MPPLQPPTPRSYRLHALVFVNLALLAALALLQFAPKGRMGFESIAAAQSGVARPHGQYLVVSGRLNGMPANAIYLMDTVNQEIVAVRWERSRNDLMGLGYRNVGEDGKTAGGGR